MAELADAQDLKSCGTYTPVPVRFRSTALSTCYRCCLISYVGVAQLDGASGYGPEGREFESSRPRKNPYKSMIYRVFLFMHHTIHDKCQEFMEKMTENFLFCMLEGLLYRSVVV